MSRKALFTTASALFFILGIASIGGVYYFYTLTVRAQEVLTTLIEDEKNGGIKDGKEARDREVLRSTEGERLVLAKIFSQDMVSVLKQIETIGFLTGTALTVESVSPENAHPKDVTLLSATVRLAGTGAFADLLRAQEALADIPVALQVQSYTLSKSEDAWRLTSTLRVYVKDKKNALPTATSTAPTTQLP